MIRKICFVVVFLSLSLFGCRHRTIEQENYDSEALEIANSYFEKGLYLQAKNLYEVVSVLDSTNYSVVYRLGICFDQLDEFEKSINEFQSCVDGEYRIVDSYFNIGNLYLKLLNEEKAYKHFLRALELSPNDEELKRKVKLCEQLIENKRGLK